MLTDMGYIIELYNAIEKDHIARGITRMHLNEGVMHLALHDLMKMSACLADTYMDIIATPECAPWSRSNEPPKGFDDDRAHLFEQAADIIRDQQQRNQHLNVIFENTEIHPKLVKQGNAETQEELLKGKFYVSNACDLGGMSSRLHRICTQQHGYIRAAAAATTCTQLLCTATTLAPSQAPNVLSAVKERHLEPADIEHGYANLRTLRIYDN